VNGQQSGGIVRAALPDETTVGVRVRHGGDGLGSVGRDNAIDLNEALAPIGEVAALLRQRLQPLQPVKTTVEFGVSFAVESGTLTTVVFESDAEASLTVTLEWDAAAAKWG
jgi:hypothetical protein